MYILECADKSYYTGSARNIESRLYQHETVKGSVYTSKRLPIKLVCLEEYDRIDDAVAREKLVQGWTRKKKKRLLIANMKLYLHFQKIIPIKKSHFEFKQHSKSNNTRTLRFIHDEFVFGY